MLSISKPQTNLIYLSILTGRLDLTRFKYPSATYLCTDGVANHPHFTYEYEP